MHQRLVIGLEGPVLTADERDWLRNKPPRGVILFARNIESPEQVRALLADVRACAGEDVWAVIDEEGGRVHRLPWPPFAQRRDAADYGAMYRIDAQQAAEAVFQDALEAGKALKALGFTHNCAPVLDVFSEAGHDVIGRRAYSDDPAIVTALAKACMRGLHAAGVAAVGKHFPGHGRADADSHAETPCVDAPLDVVINEARPFAELAREGLAHIMTAHVRYASADRRVATRSPFWLREVLRGMFAFDGMIWSDDLCMKGVGEDAPSAARAAAAAGCDILLVCEPEGVGAVYASLQDDRPQNELE